MLLKYSKIQQRSKLSATGKPRSSGKLKAVGKGKAHKKALKNAANKRIKPLVKREDVPTPVTADPCENSNDSGLGFDHHLEFAPRITQTSFIEPDHCWTEEAKRQRLDVKLECDNANDNFTFPKTRVAPPTPSPICQKGGKTALANKGKRSAQLYVSQSVSLSRDGKVQLQILSQPEMQHRARYQTEGSRGAVKDRTGNSFPIVKLSGYDKPATLDVYIGTDQGRIAPHMFYQACRVSGKNSTPCVEKKVNGTVIIEIELDPAKDMIATCDCVGILKERNVDVEHRFPEESSGRSKKKSTRCRMVFRTVIMNDDNVPETLQVTSQPIICTQPPGVPEICKKSLSSCAANGGVELFILGKNFLKDTRVLFSEGEFGTDLYWEALVQPDKEFLQQSHLVCVIPPYRQEHIKEPVSVRLNVISSERSSDAHTFVYTPIGTSPMQALAQEPNIVNKSIAPNIATGPPFPGQNLLLGMPLMMPANHIQMASPTFIAEEAPKCKNEESLSPVMLMPPPAALPARRASQSLIINDSMMELKREAESPSPSVPGTSDLSASQTPSMATLRKFVSTPNAPLPSLSVETYFSRIENKTETTPSHLSNIIQTSQPRTSEMNAIFTSPLGQVPLLQNEILSTQIDFESNRSTENEKLDALVNSTAESHLSPNRENTTKEEIVLNTVLSEVAPVPMQTSPLNLNTNESCPSQIPSPTILNMPQPSLPITTAMLNPLPTEEVLISQSYAGNDIRTVTDTININVNPIPSTIFNNDINTTASITQVTNSSDLIMKAVVNDLTPQFTEGISIQNQNPIILPSNFTSPNASINATSVGTDFIARETSPTRPQFSTNILNKYVQETMKEEPPAGYSAQIFSSDQLKNTQANQFSQDIIFTTASEMPRENNFQVKNEILNEANFQANPALTTQSITVKLEPAEPTFVQPNILIGTYAETKTSNPTPSIGQTVTSPIQTPTIQSRTEIPKTSEGSQVKKCEEGIPFPHELTQMSEHDLLSYINPSCFDQV